MFTTRDICRPLAELLSKQVVLRRPLEPTGLRIEVPWRNKNPGREMGENAQYPSESCSNNIAATEHALKYDLWRTVGVRTTWHNDNVSPVPHSIHLPLFDPAPQNTPKIRARQYAPIGAGDAYIHCRHSPMRGG